MNTEMDVSVPHTLKCALSSMTLETPPSLRWLTEVRVVALIRVLILQTCKTGQDELCQKCGRSECIMGVQGNKLFSPLHSVFPQTICLLFHGHRAFQGTVLDNSPNIYFLQDLYHIYISYILKLCMYCESSFPLYLLQLLADFLRNT